MAKLERVMQETIQDIHDVIHAEEGKVVDTYQLSYGYVGCVIASIVSIPAIVTIIPV